MAMATYRTGDRVEYVAAPVFDLIIRTGDVGVVTKVENGWVQATWPRSGEHSVPVDHVRGAPRQSVDLDAVHAELQERRAAWVSGGLAAGPFTWRDSAATWPYVIETDRGAVTDPESLGVVLGDPSERYAELVLWRGGWADANGFDGVAIFSEAPRFSDVVSCLAVVDALVARLGA